MWPPSGTTLHFCIDSFVAASLTTGGYLWGMEIFPSMDLVAQPDNSLLAEQVVEPHPEKRLLVIYDSNLPFLERVLGAAGYKNPKDELHLIRHESGEEPFDLASLLGRLEVSEVILFGQELAGLGLHFQIARYAPVRIADRLFMVCESVEKISSAKEKGNNQPAAALWKGIKAAFLKEKPAEG